MNFSNCLDFLAFLALAALLWKIIFQLMARSARVELLYEINSSGLDRRRCVSHVHVFFFRSSVRGVARRWHAESTQSRERAKYYCEEERKITIRRTENREPVNAQINVKIFSFSSCNFLQQFNVFFVLKR